MEELNDNSKQNPYSPPVAGVGLRRSDQGRSRFSGANDDDRARWSNVCVFISLTLFTVPLLHQLAVGLRLIEPNALLSYLIFPCVCFLAIVTLFVGPFICFHIGRSR